MLELDGMHTHAAGRTRQHLAHSLSLPVINNTCPLARVLSFLLFLSSCLHRPRLATPPTHGTPSTHTQDLLSLNVFKGAANLVMSKDLVGRCRLHIAEAAQVSSWLGGWGGWLAGAAGWLGWLGVERPGERLAVSLVSRVGC
jgi:hypothetical protein